MPIRSGWREVDCAAVVTRMIVGRIHQGVKKNIYCVAAYAAYAAYFQ